MYPTIELAATLLKILNFNINVESNELNHVKKKQSKNVIFTF